MQTPGRKVEAQTPMIAINRRVNSVFERLSKVENDVVDIERPQQRTFGRLINQLQVVNNSMSTIENLIKQDVEEKKKYYAEEAKLLEKDSRNLQDVKRTLGRQLLAGALGAYGISQILGGNFGQGAMGVGGAAALLTPEILGVITTVVTTKLASSGLLSRGGAGVGLGSKVAGASKLKNPLLITAALAASLILPGLVSANQNADRRRQISAQRVIRGRETISKPDVDRFRAILGRFDAILSGISFDRRRTEEGTLDENLVETIIEGDMKDDNNSNDEVTSNPFNPEFDIMKFMESTGLVEPPPGFENKEENITKNENISLIDNSSEEKIINKGDVKVNDNSFQSTNVALGDINPDLSNNTSVDLGSLSIETMISKNFNNNNAKGGGNIIDLSSINNDQPKNSSRFSGLTAKRTYVKVNTRFNSSGGTIDKFESATALGTGVGLA